MSGCLEIVCIINLFALDWLYVVSVPAQVGFRQQ